MFGMQARLPVGIMHTYGSPREEESVNHYVRFEMNFRMRTLLFVTKVTKRHENYKYIHVERKTSMTEKLGSQ